MTAQSTTKRKGSYQRVNPVLIKELRGRMRGARAFIVLTIYLLLLSCLTGLIYYLYTINSAGPGTYSSPASLSELGTTVFSTVVIVELMLVTFITPAFTAGAITGERERQTYETLRATLLPARKIVTGKLIAALTYVGLLILATVPLESLAFILGGVVLEELLVALVILLVTALAFASLGIFFSSLARSTLVATVLSYGTTLMMTLGLPAILLFGATMFLDPILYGYGPTPFNPSVLVQAVLVYALYTLANLSPIVAAIFTKVILVEESSLWYFELPLSSGSSSTNLPLPSGWLVYSALYLLLSLLLLMLTTWRIKRQEIR